MPGHLTSFKVGGHFGAKGSSLNHLGAGAPLRRFNNASESPRSGTRRQHRQTESCKPNKTKQNHGPSCRKIWVATLPACGLGQIQPETHRGERAHSAPARPAANPGHHVGEGGGGGGIPPVAWGIL